MKKEMYLVEVVNVVAWANQLTPEKLNKLNFKLRWALKKALSKLVPDAQEFIKFRDGEVAAMRDKWFDDEHSVEYMEPGEDNDGVVETTPMRKIKDEYMEVYQKEIDELNDRINEILAEKNTYEYTSADVDDFVNSVDEIEPLEFQDLEILDALLSDKGEA